MPFPTAMAALLSSLQISARTDEPLLKKTWWRAGGLADLYVEADDLATLAAVARAAHQTGTAVFVLGNASNTLISDLGIRGVTVRLQGALATATALPDRRVELGAGVKLVSLLKRAEREAWTGLEMFAGIPGTVGGAVRMNAGTTLGSVSDRLIDIDILTETGEQDTLPAAALAMSYRHSVLPRGAIVTAARLALTDDDPAESVRKIEEHLAHRARTQPVDVPTCGSTFRNPPGEHAGKLIERCGLKGLQIGGAVVSEKHANFLVNTGNATATDLRRLIEEVQRRTADASGIWLVPEVHLAGDWSGWEGTGRWP